MSLVSTLALLVVALVGALRMLPLLVVKGSTEAVGNLV